MLGSTFKIVLCPKKKITKLKKIIASKLGSTNYYTHKATFKIQNPTDFFLNQTLLKTP